MVWVFCVFLLVIFHFAIAFDFDFIAASASAFAFGFAFAFVWLLLVALELFAEAQCQLLVGDDDDAFWILRTHRSKRIGPADVLVLARLVAALVAVYWALWRYKVNLFARFF